jgi:hypothetical protein
MVIASYAASRRGLLLRAAALSPVLGLVFGLLDFLTTPLRGALEAVPFVAFVGIGTFYAYYFGFHQIYLVELTPVELRWQHALRGGVARLGDVQSIRCSKVSRRGVTVDVATVEFTSRRPLKFGSSTPGLTEFLAKIYDTAPRVTVKPSRR